MFPSVYTPRAAYRAAMFGKLACFVKEGMKTPNKNRLQSPQEIDSLNNLTHFRKSFYVSTDGLFNRDNWIKQYFTELVRARKSFETGTKTVGARAFMKTELHIFRFVYGQKNGISCLFQKWEKCQFLTQQQIQWQTVSVSSRTQNDHNFIENICLNYLINHTCCDMNRLRIFSPSSFRCCSIHNRKYERNARAKTTWNRRE